MISTNIVLISDLSLKYVLSLEQHSSPVLQLPIEIEPVGMIGILADRLVHHI